MTHLLTLAVAAAISGSLLAQTNNRIGLTTGLATYYTTRVGATNIVADVMNHYDSRSYQDWLLDPADPTGTTYKFLGFEFVIQDQIGTTTEAYNLVAYNEDPLNVNFPDPNGLWFRTGNLNMPASTSTGAVAWIITLTLPANVASAPKGDKWIGINLSPPASGTWPTDGASLHAAYDRVVNSTAAPITDQAGPRIDSVPNNQFGCHLPVPGGVPTGPAVYPGGTAGTRLELRFEIIANVTGGVCVTQTNQTNYPVSNPGATGSTPLGGTTNFISGLHPDVYDGNGSTVPRADNIGFLVTEVNFPNAPVFVILAFGPSPVGNVPLALLSPVVAHPNTRGNVCIDFVNGVTFFGLSNAQGLYQHMLTLTPAARLIVQGLSAPQTPFDFWYQAFVLNVATSNPFEVHATGCGVQHL